MILAIFAALLVGLYLFDCNFLILALFDSILKMFCGVRGLFYSFFLFNKMVYFIA
jgi:hypothetical protein